LDDTSDVFAALRLIAMHPQQVVPEDRTLIHLRINQIPTWH
jgi:hypothetical protein